jgi:hypothetical protein
MKPKPFWLLNHFTVPVAIFFSKACNRTPRDNHAIKFNFVDDFGKRARGRIQQGTAANRMVLIYACFLQSTSAIPDFASRAKKKAIALYLIRYPTISSLKSQAG